MNALQNNRWHSTEYSDNILKAGYIEWKYFNFTAPGCSGIFVYLMIDPLNIIGIGGGRIISRVFTPDGIFGGSQKFPASSIHPSKKDARIKIGKNEIKIDETVYNIRGKINTVEWNLQYVPAVPAIQGVSDLSLDPLNLEKASWFIQMPKAKVRGVIKVNEKEININTLGYSDANWGTMIPLISQFNWAQYNDEEISVVVGEIQNLEIAGRKINHWREAYITYGEEKVIFAENNFIIEHLRWRPIPDTKIKIPYITKMEGENDKYKISLTLETKIADPLYFKMPLSFPIKPAVVEQTTLFRGDLFKKENGKITPLHFINGDGFKEYSFRDVSINNQIKTGILI